MIILCHIGYLQYKIYISGYVFIIAADNTNYYSLLMREIPKTPGL